MLATPSRDGCTSLTYGYHSWVQLEMQDLCICLYPAYAPISEWLHQLEQVLIDDLHWATDTPYTHPEFFHKVFQRHILKFIGTKILWHCPSLTVWGFCRMFMLSSMSPVWLRRDLFLRQWFLFLDYSGIVISGCLKRIQCRGLSLYFQTSDIDIISHGSLDIEAQISVISRFSHTRGSIPLPFDLLDGPSLRDNPFKGGLSLDNAEYSVCSVVHTFRGHFHDLCLLRYKGSFIFQRTLTMRMSALYWCPPWVLNFSRSLSFLIWIIFFHTWYCRHYQRCSRLLAVLAFSNCQGPLLDWPLPMRCRGSWSHNIAIRMYPDGGFHVRGRAHSVSSHLIQRVVGLDTVGRRIHHLGLTTYGFAPELGSYSSPSANP